MPCSTDATSRVNSPTDSFAGESAKPQQNVSALTHLAGFLRPSRHMCVLGSMSGQIQHHIGCLRKSSISSASMSQIISPWKLLLKRTRAALCYNYFRYNDIRLSFIPSCLLLDSCGRQTCQLTALKPQPQLSQKQIVKLTAIHSLIHCIMHPPAQFVELLLTHNTSRSLQSSYRKCC